MRKRNIHFNLSGKKQPHTSQYFITIGLCGWWRFGLRWGGINGIGVDEICFVFLLHLLILRMRMRIWKCKNRKKIFILKAICHQRTAEISKWTMCGGCADSQLFYFQFNIAFLQCWDDKGIPLIPWTVPHCLPNILFFAAADKGDDTPGNELWG